MEWTTLQIDGLASVHSIERFLCQKGITQMEGQAEQAAVGAEERNRRRNVGVQIMIDNTPLPSDWSVLQVGDSSYKSVSHDISSY